MDLFSNAYIGGGWWEAKIPLPSQKSVTHPTMKKLGSYTLLEEGPKNTKSRDTPLEFC